MDRQSATTTAPDRDQTPQPNRDGDNAVAGGLAISGATDQAPASWLLRLPASRLRQDLLRTLGPSVRNHQVQRLVGRSSLQRHGEGEGGTATATKPKLDWAKLEVFIKQSSRGNEALQIKDKYKVPITLASGGPVAFFAPDTGKCTIDATRPGPEVAAYFAHEMHHAKQFFEGKSPPAKGADEDTWVKMMVKEEIDGTIKGFEAKLEMEQKAGAPKDDTPVCMTFYRSAYNHGKKTALEANKTEEEAHAAGLANGRRMVRFLISPSDGSHPRLGPNQLQSYEQYYRREWRQKNLPKP